MGYYDSFISVYEHSFRVRMDQSGFLRRVPAIPLGQCVTRLTGSGNNLTGLYVAMERQGIFSINICEQFLPLARELNPSMTVTHKRRAQHKNESKYDYFFVVTPV